MLSACHTCRVTVKSMEIFQIYINTVKWHALCLTSGCQHTLGCVKMLILDIPIVTCAYGSVNIMYGCQVYVPRHNENTTQAYITPFQHFRCKSYLE